MDVRQAVRVAWRSLLANPLRSALTILGMAIGVGAVITLMSIGQGAQAAVQTQFTQFGTNLLFLEPGTTTAGGVAAQAGAVQTLTNEDALAIDEESVPSISAVSREVYTPAQFIALGQNTFGQLNGVTPVYAQLRNYRTYQGDFITQEQLDSDANVAVIGYNLAQNLFGESSPIGQKIRVNTGPGRSGNFTITGVGELRGGQGFANPDNAVYVPLSTALRQLIRPKRGTGEQVLNRITLQAADDQHIKPAMQEISDLLMARHHISDPTLADFVITSQADRLQARLQVTAVLTIFLGAVAGISLVVGGIGIMNIMLVSVTERTREIGIRKAVGARRHDILVQFLVEALLVSFMGGLGGIVVGLVLAMFVNGREMNGQVMQTLVTVESILLAGGVSAAIGLFFGVYPASRAARLNPIQALRYE